METSLLINKLVECAKEIEGGHLDDADLLLEEIIAANESFSKPTKSLVKYYAEALVRRLYRLYPRNLTPLIPSGTDRFPETDYPFAPFFCFGDFTTLDPARDALKGKRRVHIIEFGMVVSFWRYCDLFRDITTQSTGPISFRLTFVGPILSTVADHTQNTLERLHGEAERFAIYFDQVRRLVANSAADIVDSVLKLTRASEDETIVVKWKFQFHKLLTLTGAIEKSLQAFFFTLHSCKRATSSSLVHLHPLATVSLCLSLTTYEETAAPSLSPPCTPPPPTVEDVKLTEAGNEQIKHAIPWRLSLLWQLLQPPKLLLRLFGLPVTGRDQPRERKSIQGRKSRRKGPNA
ncbi:hypothetical protein OIU78_028035 [Salix suchowensis]|nr:hypothetical protein OIU78_028035 [Salix suchowensis]